MKSDGKIPNLRLYGVGIIVLFLVLLGFVGVNLGTGKRVVQPPTLPIPTTNNGPTQTVSTQTASINLVQVTPIASSTVQPSQTATLTVSDTTSPSSTNSIIRYGKWVVYESLCKNTKNFKSYIFDINADGTYIKDSTNSGFWNIVDDKITFTMDYGPVWDNGNFYHNIDEYHGIIDGDKIKKGLIISSFLPASQSRCWNAVAKE